MSTLVIQLPARARLQGGAEGHRASAQPGGAGDKGDVLDAEFEEVNKDKGSKD